MQRHKHIFQLRMLMLLRCGNANSTMQNLITRQSPARLGVLRPEAEAHLSTSKAPVFGLAALPPAHDKKLLLEHHCLQIIQLAVAGTTHRQSSMTPALHRPPVNRTMKRDGRCLHLCSLPGACQHGAVRQGRASAPARTGDWYRWPLPPPRQLDSAWTAPAWPPSECQWPAQMQLADMSCWARKSIPGCNLSTSLSWFQILGLDKESLEMVRSQVAC